MCPEDGCDFCDPTARVVWAHALEAHGIEEDKKQCLWDGCGFMAKFPAHYLAHEPIHTGVWPHSCATCGKGWAETEFARQCCTIHFTCGCGATFKGRKVNAKRTYAAQCARTGLEPTMPRTPP